ncbi:MAG: nucleotidyltransferase domain-containing protein [Gammaproteobacteria bacterium]|nr:MAG: nucleotidyltransferase domain-containing protein [Gammaproteobacteria bacterium]
MRLYKDEKNALNKALENINDEVYLFGSRADDNKKGGDIDILIYSKQDPFKLSTQISTQFYNDLEAKLDVIIFDKNNMTAQQKAFVKTLSLVKIK